MVTYIPHSEHTALRSLLHQRGHAPETSGIGQPAWMSRAACRGCDPEVFYPAEGGPAREALTICFSCPVVDDCLAWALSIENITGCYGVIGGATAAHRADMLRRKRVGI